MNRSRILSGLTTIALLFTLLGCGDESSVLTEPSPSPSLSVACVALNSRAADVLNKNTQNVSISGNLNAGETVTLTYTLTGNGAMTLDSWFSGSNTSILSGLNASGSKTVQVPAGTTGISVRVQGTMNNDSWSVSYSCH